MVSRGIYSLPQFGLHDSISLFSQGFPPMCLIFQSHQIICDHFLCLPVLQNPLSLSESVWMLPLQCPSLGSLCTPRASRCYLVWSTKKCPQWGPCPNPQNLWLWYLVRGTLQMWLRILKWEKYTGLSRWAQCNHKRPYKRELGGQEERSCWLAGFWEGQGAEECRWPLGDGKGQERGSPHRVPRRSAAGGTMILVLWHFKPLSLW